MRFQLLIVLCTCAIAHGKKLMGQADVPGTGVSRYYDTVEIATQPVTGGYALYNHARKIYVFDNRGGNGGIPYSNSSPNWPQRRFLKYFVSTALNADWIEPFTEDPSLPNFSGMPDLQVRLLDGAVLLQASSELEQAVPPAAAWNPLEFMTTSSSNVIRLIDLDDIGTDDILADVAVPVSDGLHSFNVNGTAGSFLIMTEGNPALDLFWSLCQTYDFYYDKFQLVNFSGQPGTPIYAHYNVPDFKVDGDQRGASTSTVEERMYFGKGLYPSRGPAVSLDLVAHEYTHLVLDWPVLTSLSKQSRALNESFCDIMSAAVEITVANENPWVDFGDPADRWEVGEKTFLTSNSSWRSLSDPPSRGHSKFFQDPLWYSNNASSDPYAITGLQNYWFYLLVNGGTVMIAGIPYSVNGVGLETAIQVVYRNMTQKVNWLSDYQDAVNGSIESAEELFPGTNVALEVMRAWHAVNLFPDPNQSCPGAATFIGTSGSFTDGSGNNDYANGLDCNWLIAPTGAEQISLHFTSFNVATGDTVYIHNGGSVLDPILAKYSGTSIPASVVNAGGGLYVRFLTSGSGTAPGWSATYSSNVTTYCSSAEFPFNAGSGSFEDGSGANSYSPNTQCAWYIAPPGATSVTLSFAQFNTETTNDVVRVYSTLDTSQPPLATLSGASIPAPVVSPTGQMFVTFTTNSSNNLAGWSANYTSTGAGYCSGTSTLTAVTGAISDGSGSNSYYNNSNCSWLIQPTGASAVELTFTAFAVEAASQGGTIYDRVVVYDGTSTSAPVIGTFHGSSIPGPIVSSGPALFINFTTDNATTAAGWSANYTALTGTTCSGVTTLSGATGSFGDGSGANNYANNSICDWRIQPNNAVSIVLTFDAFNTQLNADGVIVYDGPTTSSMVLGVFTGTTLPPVLTSSGGAMLVRFVSDAATTAPGFAAHYTANISEGGTIALVGYEYWFDGNDDDAVYQSIVPTYRFTLTGDFDTDMLPAGLHTFHIRFKDNEGAWSSVLSQSFNKAVGVGTPTPVLSEWEYWFDEAYGDAVGSSLTGQTAQIIDDIDTDALPIGLHTLHTRIKGTGGWSSVLSQSFYKAPSSPSATISGYEYWFDEAYAAKVSATVGPVPQFTLGSTMAAANLPDGLHTLHIRFVGSGGWSSVLSQGFYKAGNVSSLPNLVDAYRYWFDDSAGNMVLNVLGSPVSPYMLSANIDAGALSAGSHAFHIQFRDLSGRWSSILSQTFTRVPLPTVTVPLKVIIEGPYDSGTQLMSDALRTGGHIPLIEPFTAAGLTHVGEGGGETINAAVLSVTGNNAIVDWVFVEARDENNSSLVVNTRSALLQRDGDVVGLDGVSPLSMQLGSDNYYVAVRHRNHLGAMTLNPVSLSGSTSVIDFTSPALSTYGTEARKSVSGKMALWAGNALLDDVIKYTGLNNDRDKILVRIGGVVPTNTVLGYHAEDHTLDGVVKYTGASNDRDRILVNIGGVVPTQVRFEQLP